MEGQAAERRRRRTEAVDYAPLRARARRAADDTDGVLNRSLLRGLGIDDVMIRREIRAGRWAAYGSQTVAVHTAALGRRALLQRAIWEIGPAIAVIDGVSALQVAGLQLTDDRIHLSVPHTVTLKSLPGVVGHKIRRRVPGEVVAAGITRTRPAIAAVRAAHWATTDRQAALFLTAPVQQRLVLPASLYAAALAVHGRTRRAFILAVVADLSDGVQSLGELDFARACRRRGLPEPTRQSIRPRRDGRYYLDVYWEEARLVVEIDGIDHALELAVVDDALRQNAITLGDDVVLRVPLLGWRLHRDAYLDQVCAAYHDRRRRWERRAS